MANEYATSADLKATLELGGETFADPDIDLAIPAASRAVDQVCGRRFYKDTDATSVRYYSPTGGERLWIDDIVTVTTVQADPGGDGTFEETWTVNTDYILEPMNAAADGWPYTTLRLHPRSSRYLPVDYPRSVKVTGQFGWSAVPESVAMATKLIASKLVKRVREAPFGVVGLGFDGAAVRIASQDPDVRVLLAGYVRVTF